MIHPVRTCAQWDDVRVAVETKYFVCPPDPTTIYNHRRAMQTNNLRKMMTAYLEQLGCSRIDNLIIKP
uniref:Uncharacterized protein n=1 Tax=Arundo donax TaxID=35708 RepID=A0A0A9BP82_ARUDO